MLTGKELIEQKIITGEVSEENVAQHGIDLNVIKFELIRGGGFIPKYGKTTLSKREEVKVVEPTAFNNEDGSKRTVWMLIPGIYEVTFAQGCNVPSNKRLDIVQRSSMSRNGGFIRSAVFDAGFSTENMGTIIAIHLPIAIEFGARIAQVVSYESNEVENTYKGQYQGDKQREGDRV